MAEFRRCLYEVLVHLQAMLQNQQPSCQELLQRFAFEGMNFQSDESYNRIHLLSVPPLLSTNSLSGLFDHLLHQSGLVFPMFSQRACL